VSRGEYLVIEDEELEALQIESTRTIEIEQFVPQVEVDPVYRNGSHYIAPDGRVAEEAFAVIREAMRRREVVGLGRVVLARKERLVMLDPRGKGLLATTLHYRHELRDAAAYFEDIPAAPGGSELCARRGGVGSGLAPSHDKAALSCSFRLQAALPGYRGDPLQG
jgi:DNA end-binding protein Ku